MDIATILEGWWQNRLGYATNVLNVKNADVCQCSKFIYNYELYIQSFVCGSAVLTRVCLWLEHTSVSSQSVHR